MGGVCSITSSGEKSSRLNYKFQVVVESPYQNMENRNHKILALKYRPLIFGQIIGQDLMVQTITNSIKSNRIANAFMLTGVRGTGKTSMARIISKALTCTGNFYEDAKCKAEEFCHCEEITNCKHLDVLEMDAASKTGVDDVRK